MSVFLAGRKTPNLTILYPLVFCWFGYATHAQDVLNYYLQPGENVIIGDPNPFYGQTTTIWKFSSPPQTKLNLKCSNVDMPQYYNCAYRFVVSLTGDDRFSDGINYCKKHSFELNSESNALSVGLATADGDYYWYYCQITAISTSTTAPPTQCDCGWSKQKRIVNGVETIVNEFPFMAAMVRNGRAGVACGAVIVSNYFCLTAAHCAYNQNIKDYTLRVGAHNLSPNSGTTGESYSFSGVIIHENYNPNTFVNDIAILVTMYPIKYSLDVGPACLPYRYVDVDITNARVTCMGWGSKFQAGPQSNTLQKVDLLVISNQECQKTYPTTPIGQWSMCTYDRNKDACQFDSGGPCAWYDPYNTQRQQLFGLISQGKGCGENATGINTNVGAFVNWIFAKTGKNNYCLR